MQGCHSGCREQRVKDGGCLLGEFSANAAAPMPPRLLTTCTRLCCHSLPAHHNTKFTFTQGEAAAAQAMAASGLPLGTTLQDTLSTQQQQQQQTSPAGVGPTTSTTTSQAASFVSQAAVTAAGGGMQHQQQQQSAQLNQQHTATAPYHPMSAPDGGVGGGSNASTPTAAAAADEATAAAAAASLAAEPLGVHSLLGFIKQRKLAGIGRQQQQQQQGSHSRRSSSGSTVSAQSGAVGSVSGGSAAAGGAAGQGGKKVWIQPSGEWLCCGCWLFVLLSLVVASQHEERLLLLAGSARTKNQAEGLRLPGCLVGWIQNYKREPACLRLSTMPHAFSFPVLLLPLTPTLHPNTPLCTKPNPTQVRVVLVRVLRTRSRAF